MWEKVWEVKREEGRDPPVNFWGVVSWRRVGGVEGTHDIMNDMIKLCTVPLSIQIAPSVLDEDPLPRYLHPEMFLRQLNDQGIQLNYRGSDIMSFQTPSDDSYAQADHQRGFLLLHGEGR